MKKITVGLLGLTMLLGASVPANAMDASDAQDAIQITTAAISNNTISETDNFDYFYFIPNETDDYTIRLDNLTADADLYLYDSNFKLLAYSDWEGTHKELFTRELQKGQKYYIAVEGYHYTGYVLDIDKFL